LRWEGYIHETLGVKRNLRRGTDSATRRLSQALRLGETYRAGRRLKSLYDFVGISWSGKLLQLFGPTACPVTEMQLIDMKNNIIIFTPQEERQETRSRGTWIRIENEAASSLIESLLVFWLGAWSLFAGIEFLRSTGILVF
jgi:hypothetical protein